MNAETKLLITDKGSIMLPTKVLGKPGQVVVAGDFAKNPDYLKRLIAEGNLTSNLDTPVTLIDYNRTKELAPPIPREIDMKAGQSIRSSGSTDDGRIAAKLAEVKARSAAAAKRQATLSELGEVELTVDEARELGVVGG